MHSNNMPRLSFQKQSPIGEDYWHSIALSAARGLAALVVAAAHLRAEMYPGLRTLSDPSLWFKGFAFFTGFAHQAVLVFFVISGWLVGGSLLNKMGQPGVMTTYAIDRVTRLWTVLVPTYVVTVLLGLASGVLRPGAIDFSITNEFSAVSFIGNLLGLQRVVLDDFGGNYALWSLANETWYYVMFPVLVLLFTARRAMSRAACGAALALAFVVLNSEILMYFVVWLLGVAFSRVRIDCSAGFRYAVLAPLLAASVFFRLTGENDRFDHLTIGMDLLLSLLLLVLLSSIQFKVAPTSTLAHPLATVGQFFANFSFSLYVLHLPLIFLIKHLALTQFGLHAFSPSDPLHFVIFLCLLATIVLCAYVFYLLFEAHTYRIRKLVKNAVARRAVTLPAAVDAPAKR